MLRHLKWECADTDISYEFNKLLVFSCTIHDHKHLWGRLEKLDSMQRDTVWLPWGFSESEQADHQRDVMDVST
jgi:hypothetical protein